MTRRKLFADISFSTTQTVFNQLASFVLFFLVSRQLDKTSFGTLNWMLATIMTAFTILGLGYDQLAVKKTANGASPLQLFNDYFFHAILASICFIAIAAVVLLTNGGGGTRLFLLLALGQALLLLSLPSKQIAAGLQQFGLLCWMSVIANAIKLMGVVYLAYSGQLSLIALAWLFAFGAFAECLVCLLIYRYGLKQPVILRYRWLNHASLMRESLPQLGITVTNVLVLRADWILLGLLASAATVADYSFAYRCFEFSVLPLTILGPVLLPRIVRMIQNETDTSANSQPLLAMMRLEIMAAVFIALVANTGWTQSIDFLTANKYGHPNRYLFMVLSLCTPLLYLNNIFWSINFARGNMSLILRCIVLTFFVNLIADLLLIPFFASPGAAIGFVLGMAVQTIFYARNTNFPLAKIWNNLFGVMAAGIAAALITSFISIDLLRLIMAPVFFLLIVYFTGNWPLRDWLQFKKTGLV